jgi:hypothetical protein
VRRACLATPSSARFSSDAVLECFASRVLFIADGFHRNASADNNIYVFKSTRRFHVSLAKRAHNGHARENRKEVGCSGSETHQFHRRGWACAVEVVEMV